MLPKYLTPNIESHCYTIQSLHGINVNINIKTDIYAGLQSPVFMNSVTSFQITWVLKTQLAKHYRPQMQVPIEALIHGVAALWSKKALFSTF